MTKIVFGQLHIGSVSDGSAVHHGQNVLVGQRHSAKVNEGFGQVDGVDNELYEMMSAVVDRDQVDAWISRTAQARRRFGQIIKQD